MLTPSPNHGTLRLPNDNDDAFVAPTFVTSTTFVTAHQFCQFISTAFVNITTSFLSTQSSPGLSAISATYVVTDEVTTFVNKARPLLSTVIL